MKKILVTVLMLFGVFALTGCDEFGFNEENTNLWYDEPAQTLHVSFNLSKPAEDSETGEVPVEFIYLVMYDKETDEWLQVHQFDSYKADDEQISFDYSVYGDITFKIVKIDALGDNLFETPELNIYINEPQFIYHFDTWFDNYSGLVQFNFGVNEFDVTYVVFEKSVDGGNTWEQVIESEVTQNADGFVKSQVEYYEFEEGTYVYRLSVYNLEKELLDTMDSWGEINVMFEEKNFTGVPEIWHVSGNFDPYSSNVSLWWDGSGDFDGFKVEKSLDMMTWELIAELPRIAQSFNYTEEVDGDYFYKVSAINENGVATFYVGEEPVRVKQDALLGGFNAWMQWDSNEVNIDWYFIKDNVHQVVLERKLIDGEYEVIGEFGSLKTMHTDSLLQPGIYVYRVSLVDEENNLLDSLESKEIKILKPEHMYNLNAWHNQSTGEIEFNFSYNQDFVSYYTIEKTSDGGLTWFEVITNDVVINDYHYDEYLRVYELEEGTYAYRITGYDALGNDVGTAQSWNEVYVNYDNLNLDSPIDIYYLEGQQNIYDNSVNLWWGSQGNYATHIVEYSLDLENWVTYIEVPRVTQSLQISDLPDGEYYFRVSLTNDGQEVDSYTTVQTVRVKQDALIGSFNGYQEWNSNVYLYWDFIKDDVALITIERRLVDETEFTLVGEFGPLKTQFIDEVEAGEYVYLISLYDENGLLLDEIESNNINVYFDEY